MLDKILMLAFSIATPECSAVLCTPALVRGHDHASNTEPIANQHKLMKCHVPPFHCECTGTSANYDGNLFLF